MPNQVFNFPVKFINIAIEALQFRIASMKVILNGENIPDEILAEIDYSNDINILETVISDLKKAKKDSNSKYKKINLPSKLGQYKEIQEAWPNEKQILFAKEIAFRVTICVRDAWADASKTHLEILEIIKQLNEFQHFVLNYRAALENNFSNYEQYSFWDSAIQNLSITPETKPFIKYLLVGSFQKIEQIPYTSFEDFSKEYLVYHQALNEVCHGAYALPDWEFSTLMGVSKPEAIMILNREIDLWNQTKSNTK